MQVKKDRLFKVEFGGFNDELKLFFDFLRTTPLLNGLLQELHTNMPSFDEWYKKMSEKRGICWPPTEEERVRLCLAFLEHCINSNEDEAFQITCNTGGLSTHSRGNSFFLEQFFMPFYEYLDGRIEERSSTLYLIEKFKLRYQWFERSRLHDLYERDTKHGESVLDKELRKFLFDNGVDYPFSTPASDSGRADIIASLHTADPLVIEVKVFDGESRGRSYIRQGFRQVCEYMTDYNKTVGYLVIFNVSDKELRLELLSTELPPRIHFGDKTVFIETVDIFHDILPASERPRLELYEIKEKELVTSSGQS